MFVAWDVDDVLNPLMRRWLEGFERTTGRVIPYDSLHANPPLAATGLSLDEYLASLDAFRRDHYASLEPSPLALEWFEAEGARTRHVAVTATPLRAASTSTDWVLRHFGRWVEHVHVVPSPRPDDPTPNPPPDKGALLARMDGPLVLVDDSPAQVAGARARGLHALLYPQPWNGSEESAVDVMRELSRLVREGA